MEPVSLGLGPVVAIAVVAALIGGWIGHVIGLSGERKRKEVALQEAETEAKSLLDDVRSESQDKLDVLSKASANELAQLKQAHSQQMDQLNGAHQTLVDSLKAGHAGEIDRLNAEHSGLVDRLNAGNNANINALEERRQKEIEALKAETATTVADLKREQQAALEDLRREHQQALAKLAAERDRQFEDLEQRHEQRSERLASQLAESLAERERLQAVSTELQETINDLRHEIKEGRMNNMFSVSRSGEKLIRVVRSVQELASELDETSRTVTGGEYSFLDEIQDQRDRDAVLRLAGAEPSLAPHRPAADDGLEPATENPRAPGTFEHDEADGERP